MQITSKLYQYCKKIPHKNSLHSLKVKLCYILVWEIIVVLITLDKLILYVDKQLTGQMFNEEGHIITRVIY